MSSVAQPPLKTVLHSIVQMALSGFLVSPDRYDFGPSRKELGHGTSGIVVEATDPTTGKKVAVKYMVKLPATLKDQQGLQREISILATANHPTTLRLLGFSLSPQFIIVTDVMEHGTFAKAILRRDPTELSICLFGVCAGMRYLHSLGVIHRDLKPANIFLNSEYEPVIADFGLSKHSRPGINQTLFIGSAQFMAPELWGDIETYGPAVDVFAFAVILYSCFAEPKIWDDNRVRTTYVQVGTAYKNGLRLARPPNVPQAHWDLITKAWHHGAESRPTFQQLEEDFRAHHAYVLPGADLAKVEAYERKIMDFEQHHLPAIDPDVLRPLRPDDPLMISFADRPPTPPRPSTKLKQVDFPWGDSE
jgi:serine/threonine protein kinase